MSKGSSILLAIVMAIGGFSLGHVVGSRSTTDTEVADAGGRLLEVPVLGQVHLLVLEGFEEALRLAGKGEEVPAQAGPAPSWRGSPLLNA